MILSNSRKSTFVGCTSVLEISSIDVGVCVFGHMRIRREDRYLRISDRQAKNVRFLGGFVEGLERALEGRLRDFGFWDTWDTCEGLKWLESNGRWVCEGVGLWVG